MNTGYVIEYLVINTFWIYTVSRFMKLFFGDLRTSKCAVAAVYVIFYIANSAVSLSFNNPLYNVLTSLCGMFFVAMLYQSSVLRNVVAICMIYIISMLCDILVATMVSSYTIGMRMDIINNVLSYLLIFTVELLIEKTMQFRTGYYINRLHIFAILGIPISSIAMILMLVVHGISVRKIIYLVSFSLLLINFLVMYLYDVLLKDYEKMYQSRFLQQEIDAYKEQFALIEDTQRKIEYLKHDMKHHLSAISAMADAGENEKIRSYIGTMVETIETDKERVLSGNNDVDSILNYMIQKAREKGICVKTKIQIATQMDVECFDLNIILGNLLENAIEAAQNAEEKEILIGLELERNVIYIDLENTYTGEPKTADNTFFTTKKNKENHGFGLSSVRSVLQKYNGCMELDYDKKRFFVKLMLYLPMQEVEKTK